MASDCKVFCHPATEWPDADDLEIVERVPVLSCVRRGVAIDLVLDRARENSSQFVFSKARGREVVFWQSARTREQARPNVAVPTARSSARHRGRHAGAVRLEVLGTVGDHVEAGIAGGGLGRRN